MTELVGVFQFSNNKVPGANMVPTWGPHDPGGPHVGPMDPAIWVACHAFSVCCVRNYKTHIFCTYYVIISSKNVKSVLGLDTFNTFST